MRNLLKTTVFSIILSSIFVFSCQKEDLQNERILNESSLVKSENFLALNQKYNDLLNGYIDYSLSLNDEEFKKFIQKIREVSNKQNTTEADKLFMCKAFNFKSVQEMEKHLNDLTFIKNNLLKEYPNINENQSVLISAFKTLNDNKPLRVRGGNCLGIYRACVTASTIAGGICVVGTGGVAAYFCALGALSASELCRQEYIGCLEE